MPAGRRSRRGSPMSAVPKTKLTEQQYLAIENAAEDRSEFFDGETFAMAGATTPHIRITLSIAAELRALLKGGRCEALPVDQRVKVERTGVYIYPDVVIVCGPIDYSKSDPLSLINLTAIIEVLSPSNEKYDRGIKFRSYKLIPSLVEYILVAQEEPLCDRYIRQADGSWALVSFVGLDAELEFTSVPARIPLAEIYAGVTFE
jgi:Uma2 family endonuclease